MVKTLKKPKHSEVADPRHFLLPSESVEDYRAYLEALYGDLNPVGHLERRQVELIVRADLEIERHSRLLAEFMHPRRAKHNLPDRNPAYELPARLQKVEEEKQARANSLRGDAAMDDIIAATTWNAPHIEAQQRALAEAYRRRSKLLGEFFAIQERRKCGEAINLKVVGGGDAEKS